MKSLASSPWKYQRQEDCNYPNGTRLVGFIKIPFLFMRRGDVLWEHRSLVDWAHVNQNEQHVMRCARAHWFSYPYSPMTLMNTTISYMRWTGNSGHSIADAEMEICFDNCVIETVKTIMDNNISLTINKLDKTIQMGNVFEENEFFSPRV